MSLKYPPKMLILNIHMYSKNKFLLFNNKFLIISSISGFLENGLDLRVGWCPDKGYFVGKMATVRSITL